MANIYNEQEQRAPFNDSPMTRYTIIDGAGRSAGISFVASDRAAALKRFGTNRMGGPYSARPETIAEALLREQSARENDLSGRCYRSTC